MSTGRVQAPEPAWVWLRDLIAYTPIFAAIFFVSSALLVTGLFSPNDRMILLFNTATFFFALVWPAIVGVAFLFGPLGKCDKRRRAFAFGVLKASLSALIFAFVDFWTVFNVLHTYDLNGLGSMVGWIFCIPWLIVGLIMAGPKLYKDAVKDFVWLILPFGMSRSYWLLRTPAAVLLIICLFFWPPLQKKFNESRAHTVSTQESSEPAAIADE